MESQHAVAVLVTSPEGIPLIRDPKKPVPQYWKLSGGRSEGNETPEECAVREIYQELGLKIKEDDLTVLEQQERFNHTVTFFSVEVPDLKTLKKVGDEREEIKVFSDLMEIAKMPDLFPNHRTIVQKVIVSKMKK